MKPPASSAEPSRRRLPPPLADALVAVVVIGTSLLPTGDPSSHRGVPSPLFSSPWLLVFPVAATAVLLFRRRWPTAVLAGTVLLLVAGLIASGRMFTLVVPVVIAAFGLALRASRRTTLIATTATVTALIVLEVVVGGAQIVDLRILPFTTVVAAAAIAGDATRSRRAYIAAITERALRAEQTRESEARRRVAEERLRIARDLHDTVAHQITVISLHANVATASLGANPALAEQSLSTIRTAARTVLTEIGELLALLRAGADPDDAAPSVALTELDALIAEYSASGFTVTTRVEGTPVSLPEATSSVAYRVIQEGLTNAHKHGSDNRAHVLMQYQSDLIAITITNRTSAAAPTVADEVPVSGHGLQGVRERVKTVGGRVEIGSTPMGYRLQATLPFVAPAAARRARE